MNVELSNLAKICNKYATRNGNNSNKFHIMSWNAHGSYHKVINVDNESDKLPIMELK